MKIKIFFCVVATLLIVTFSTMSARAEFVSADIGVNGLTCSMCSKGTEATLKQLPFIDSISIDLNDLVAHVIFKKGVKVSIDEMREMIEEAGFSVRSITAVFNFDHEVVGKDYHFVYSGDTYHFIGVDGKTLSGLVNIRFVDKQYVSKKEYSTLSKKTTFLCYKTGTTSPCCFGDQHVMGSLYHVTL